MTAPLKKRGPAYVKMFNRLLRDPSLSIAAKGMLGILKTFANADGSNCYPSIERLAGCGGVSISTAKRLMAELRKRTTVSVFPRMSRTENNRYALEDAYFASCLAEPFRQSTGEPSPTAHRRTVTKNHSTYSAEEQPSAKVEDKIIPYRKRA